MFREIARKKQALPQDRIADILIEEKRGVLSVLGENGYPNGFPINYWYNEENGFLYFHSGKKGTRSMPLQQIIGYPSACMIRAIGKMANGR